MNEWTALADLADSISVFALGSLIIFALVRNVVITRRTHDEAMALVVKRAEDAEHQRDEAISGWKSQTEATNKLTDAVERMATRRRRYDAEGDDLPRGAT